MQVGQGNFEVGFLPLEYANLYKDSYGIELIAEAGELIPEYVCCRQAYSVEALMEAMERCISGAADLQQMARNARAEAPNYEAEKALSLDYLRSIGL